MLTKSAAMTGGGMFNSGLMRGGMGAGKVRQGQQLASAKFKAFSKAFRPPKNPFAAVNPAEIQRLADLKQSAQFGGIKVVQGLQRSMNIIPATPA
jgi:hypothetical protein